MGSTSLADQGGEYFGGMAVVARSARIVQGVFTLRAIRCKVMLMRKIV
jgi:hypothetical protein